uniref:glycosyltransferase family 4 protein n=1 Tax=Dyella soli TaxID=522319 RepID=UPI0013F47D49|nr:glycosyltransferase [Dyella soli]
MINFFPAFTPPSSGGEQRYFYLYKHLSKSFDITLVSATFPNASLETITHSDCFREIRVPKPAEADQIHWQLSSEGIGPECSALAVALAYPFDTQMSRVISEHAVGVDFIIHESPFTVPYDRGMGSDGIPRIYNAYNVEYQLARQIFKGDIGVRATEFVKFLETELIAHCEALLAISDEEADTFEREFGFEASKIFRAPNGFEPNDQDVSYVRSRNEVLFLGSVHPPNVEALDFIGNILAPALPHITFNVIGSVCKAYLGPQRANLKLLGFVDEAEKTRLLSTCGAAINPLFSGAGTNLKMLDYLAHGAPIVSTTVGARGLPLVDGEHIVVSESDAFAITLSRVLGDAVHADRLSAKGAEFVVESYSWEAIASRVAGDLEGLIRQREARRPRRKILSVCDYSVDRPMGGGQVRISALLRELGREFDVTLLCMTDDLQESSRRIHDGVLQVAIPKSEAHRLAQVEADQGYSVSVADVVSGLQCGGDSRYRGRFLKLLPNADIILFEQCYLAALLDDIPLDVPVVYSSQNIEVDLKRALYAHRDDGERWLAEVERMEAAMFRRSQLLVCVSQSDLDGFGTRMPAIKGMVIENGVRLRPNFVRSNRSGRNEPLAIFLGSSHPPNVRAARYIIEELAPELPQISFALAGSVCDAVAGDRLPSNVLLLGFLEDEEKLAALGMADVAINPLFDGGGSSLKVPDFFAAGLPMVTSAVGVRGYDAVDGVHCVIAGSDTFPASVRSLIGNAEQRQRMSALCRRFAEEELDWELLGGRFRRELRKLIPGQGMARMLVLTYRFADPPRGGAETFMLRLLEQLRANASLQIEIASTHVGAIHDHLHFSAVYDHPEDRDGMPDGIGVVHYFPVDEGRSDPFEAARKLHAVWMNESLELGRRLAKRDDRPGLLGGWNHPERAQGRADAMCWASRHAQIRVPNNATRLTIAGVSPQGTQTISVRAHEKELRAISVHGEFEFTVDLPRASDIVELCSTAVLSEASDPRVLSFIATSLSFGTANEDITIDLGVGMEVRAKEGNVDRWVSDLIEVAEMRDPAIDAIFDQIRGPHSTSRDRWLRKNLPQFDLVLVQGVPFSTAVDGVHASRCHGVPCIVLPHFHMEDRYYHWQSFYEAFRHADAVIAAPSQSKPLFFDKIGANSVVLPGGGLDPADFSADSIFNGVEAFRALHTQRRPFMLVLGRKAGAKNYAMIIEAASRLRQTGRSFDLVMIGPDDDGAPVDASLVTYYGAQPRDVVIGALAEARCLVNMSDSESFGIVLLEAWMAGTPVIARTSCTAFAELVSPEKNGLMANDVATVMEAMARYIDDAELATRHAAQGRQLAESYGWDRLAQRFAMVASDILGDCKNA